MTLPFSPPMAPMLAKAQAAIPREDGWRYEPKWDGFRAIVFLDRGEVYIGSRGERPMQRYFPELLPVLREALPRSCVVDGEIVVPVEGRLEFEALQMRIHPAESRVRMLAEEIPAGFVAFDLLATARSDLRGRPLAERWSRLEKALGRAPTPIERILQPGPAAHLSPWTDAPAEAEAWIRDLERAGLDGIIAKRADEAYRPGERGWVKVKRRKTADCVVGGYRLAKDGNGVGSLLLGLYDEAGILHHVGFSASFRAPQRRELLEVVRPHEGGDAFGPGAGPGGPSRWRSEESAWVPLAPKLVVEVAYDHTTGHRFRHGTTLLRFRDDKRPEECTLEQLRL